MISTVNNPAALPRRKGRPSNHDAFREEKYLLREEIPILPFAALDDEIWFERYGGWVIRHLRNGLDCPEFNILPAMEQHIAARIRLLNSATGGRFFRESSVLPDQWLPDLQLTGVRRDRAIELAQAMLIVTRHDQYLVRRLVLEYCHAVSSRMLVELADYSDSWFGRQLLRLVDDLACSWLAWRIKGFRLGTKQSDPAGWLEQLGLPEDTEINWVQPHNGESDANFDHIGIEIINERTQRASREFLEVMLVAAVSDLWSCVRPVAT